MSSDMLQNNCSTVQASSIDQLITIFIPRTCQESLSEFKVRISLNRREREELASHHVAHLQSCS